MRTIKEKLLENAESKYRKFSAALIPNIDNVLGVRLPILRKIAKEIYTKENFEKFLQLEDVEFMEETMLQGMVIGLIKKEPDEIIKYVRDFVPKINNWAVCDSFCNGLKFTLNHKEIVWELIKSYFKSSNEYDIRFAFVMSLSYFLDDDYIDKVLEQVDNFYDERYYSQMAVAWCVSACFVKYPDKTFEYLKKSKLDDITFKKSIQKW